MKPFEGKISIYVIILMLLLVSCQTKEAFPVTSEPTSTPTVMPTAIPTNTPTVIPTSTPVPIQLLGDSDMEEGAGLGYWWSGGGGGNFDIERSTDFAQSESHSLKIGLNQSGEINAGAFWAQTIEATDMVIPAGEKMVLSVSMKLENISGNGVAIAIRGDDTVNPSGNAEVFSTTQGFDRITGTKDWTTYTVSLVSTGAEIMGITVYLIFLDNTSGTVYFDDVTLSASAVTVLEPAAIPGSDLPTTTPVPVSCSPNCTYQDMTVAVIQTGSESGWRIANTVSFRKTAEEMGIDLVYIDCNAVSEIQKKRFQSIISYDEVDVIILAPLAPEGWDELLWEAKEVAGIPVILQGRVDASPELYAARVDHDYVEQGRQAGRAMVELLEDSPSKKVIELTGSDGSNYSDERAQGFREAIKGYGIEIVQSETANWREDEGEQVMETFLKEGEDIQAVFAHNDGMALGAIKAIQAAGLQPGVDIKIVSIDAVSKAFEAMLAGELNASVETNPDTAILAYQAALRTMNGEYVPKVIYIEGEVFTSDMPDLAEIAGGRQY